MSPRFLWIKCPITRAFPTDLDIFGLILYSMLTFMAFMSMLVYLEECVYIYKKVPANKKSVMIWVNGAAPVRTLKCNCCFIPDNNYVPFFKGNACVLGDRHHVVFGHVDPQSHHVYRHDLSMVGFCFWAARRSPFTARCAVFWHPLTFAETGSFSKLLGVLAVSALSASSCSYFAIVVFKFLILMLEEVGGDEAFLRRAGKHKLKISTGPCCCCCLCLPYVAIKR